MKTLPIIEKFVSIDGEGPMAGSLAVFIRFAGCNLRCRWCDTQYSWNIEDGTQWLTVKEIHEYIQGTKVHHVTLTGGEPLLQPEMGELLELLHTDENVLVHIETNGSIPIAPFQMAYDRQRIRYIVDYKLDQSGMTQYMAKENLWAVGKHDVYKFVIASEDDLQQAYEIIRDCNLDQRCQVYLSAVSEQISPQKIVEFMKEQHMGNVKLQLQLHKMIWPKESRGV